MSDSPTKKINELESYIEGLEKKKDNLLELRLDGVVPKDDYERKYAVISQEIEIKKSELDALKDRKREQNETKNRLKQFKETIL